MAIKEFVSLEGVDEVLARYKELQAGGEATAAAISDIGQGEGFAPVTVNIQQASQALAEHGRSVSSVSEAYHILAPLLRAAGASMSELRGFAILARGELGALAFAVGGALILALAKLEDNAKRSQGALTDLFGGSAARGQQAFDQLTKSAEQLGTSAEKLAPGFEAATVALQRFQATSSVKFVAFDTANLPSFVQGLDTAGAAYTNFIKLLRAGRLDETQAEAAAASFFKTLGDGGKVTSAMLRSLPVGTVDELAKALGRGGQQTQQFIASADRLNITTRQLEQAVAAYGAQADQAFDTKAIVTFSGVLTQTLAIVQKGFQDITGVGFSDFVVTQFKKINIEIRATIQGIIAFQEFLKKPAGTGLLELNQQFKDIDETAKKALADLDAVKQKADELKISPFIQAPLPGQVFAPPGAVAPEEIPIPKPRPADLEAAFQPVVDAAQKAHDEEVSIFSQPPFGPEGILPNEEELIATWDAFIQTLETAWQGFLAFISQNQPQFQSPAGPTSFSEFAPGGAAGGGHIRGAGTSTSDSILAWLSNNEFVMRSAAVSHYGVGFMQAINSMRLPKDFFQSFNLGGLVLPPFPSPPRFAQGGLAMAGDQGLRPVNIFFDRQKFALSGPADEVERLVKASVFEQLAAGGRSPSWRRS
jgi:hypothetical protein